ncbi:MAG: TlpA disulfide reductase family protein [Tissierellia bacterium]|nr:TlpA disulfide reductase family protein [Tissierellia bacterium]
MKKQITIFLLGILILTGCQGNKVNNNNTNTNTNTTNVNTNTNNSSSEEVSSNPIGFETFSFTGEDLEKNPLDYNIFKDKNVTLVNVWGTFCPPCIQELPDLNELNEEYSGFGFQIIGITADTMQGHDDNIDLAKEIISKQGVKYPIIVPSEDTINTYLRNIQGLPTSFFVDSEGKLISDPILGARSKNDYEKLIKKYLEEVNE